MWNSAHGVATLGRRAEGAERHAKLREMLGPSLRRKANSEGFAAYRIRFHKCYRELGQGLKRLDKTLDAAKLSPRDQDNLSV